MWITAECMTSITFYLHNCTGGLSSHSYSTWRAKFHLIVSIFGLRESRGCFNGNLIPLSAGVIYLKNMTAGCSDQD